MSASVRAEPRLRGCRTKFEMVKNPFSRKYQIARCSGFISTIHPVASFWQRQGLNERFSCRIDSGFAAPKGCSNREECTFELPLNLTEDSTPSSYGWLISPVPRYHRNVGRATKATNG